MKETDETVQAEEWEEEDDEVVEERPRRKLFYIEAGKRSTLAKIIIGSVLSLMLFSLVINSYVQLNEVYSQISAEENFSLLVYNAHNSLKELMSVRADDMVMKQEAYSNIRKNGYVSLSELTDNISNKTALNTLNVYLTAMHIKSDVIGPSYLLDANKEVNV